MQNAQGDSEPQSLMIAIEDGGPDYFNNVQKTSSDDMSPIERKNSSVLITQKDVESFG